MLEIHHVQTKTHFKRLLKKDDGISLLEILIVLAVIALIMGLVVPRVLDSFGRAKSQAAI